MTDQLKQAAQQALEALETCREDEWHSEDDFGMEQTYDEDKVAKALTALRTTLKHAAHNKQVDNALRIAIEAAWDKLDDKPVACRFCHSEKGCWAWQCDSCGEIDDVQKPTPLPVQEPVAWGWRYDSCGHAVANRLVATETSEPTLFLKNVFARGPFPLYAAPQPVQEPLTHDEIEAIGDKVANEKLVGPVANFRVRFARAIEAAHNIKEKT